MRLVQLLLKKAEDIRVSIIEMQIMPDHVHLFVKAPPVASPHRIVQQLKGYTSHELRNEFEYLRTRLPTLWTRRYYVESCGHISEDDIRKKAKR